ncbi:MAG: aromatic ring-hydroxylating dioxygenase subunit alpha [Burkholderiales bacterium]|jgi:choline monooxygenase|nr:aromatic ring-hydroxylating dioxygenase subunit alpha [Burkholderiales bacterium]
MAKKLLNNESMTPSQEEETSQLPISSYFDEALYEAELEQLFVKGPRYLGHELMVPNLNDYHVLEPKLGGDYLKCTEDGVQMFSNVCRHRQAIMLKGRGNARSTLCPLHHWAFDAQGKLKGAPHFTEKPCLHLPETTLVNWQGLLFEDNGRDIANDLRPLEVESHIDFSGYRYHSTHIDEYEGNWKTFIEVYLEDYHVRPFHPGLSHFVDCDALEWRFGEWCSAQLIGVFRELGKHGSPAYEEYANALKIHYQEGLPRYGAVWFTYFPNIMIECYPEMLVVSTVWPTGVRRYRNIVEFYHSQAAVEAVPDFIEISQRSYLETAYEDQEIIERMELGREALRRAGRNEVGPYQHPTETGMAHFHRFLRTMLPEHIA